MKKILLSVSLISFLCANDGLLRENIQKLIGKDIAILDIQKIQNTNFYVFAVKDGDKEQVLLSDNSGEIIFNSFISNEKMQKQIAESISKLKILKESDKKLMSVISKIPEEMIIRLESNNKTSDKITFLLTDVECPFCQEEFKNIEDKLKDEHIVIVFTPVKGLESAKKTAYILNNIKALKTDSEKIVLLKSFFENKNNSYEAKTDDKITTDDVFNIKELVFGSTGINYVPYSSTIIIKEKNNK